MIFLFCYSNIKTKMCEIRTINLCHVGAFPNYSKCIEGSSHYLDDKQDFDVSRKGPSTNFQAKGVCSKRRSLVYHLGSETILRYICCYLSATNTGNGWSLLLHSPIRVSFDLGKKSKKSVTIVGKNILNIVNCKVWFQNYLKNGKYRLVYICLTYVLVYILVLRQEKRYHAP